MNYDITTALERVTGIKKLVNYVEKMLLTTLGTDEENPDQGCYIKTIVGENIDNLERITNKIIREVDRIETKIKEDQIRSDFAIPKEEQLKKLELISIKRDGSGINCRYRVVNEAGEEDERELFSN